MYEIEIGDALQHCYKLRYYRDQMLEIRHLAEYEFPAGKDVLLYQRVVQLVDAARAEVEQALQPAEKAIFYSILVAALNQLPEPLDLALRFAANAIRFSGYPAPSYSTLLLTAYTFARFSQSRRAELLASQAAALEFERPDAHLLLAQIFRLMESESAGQMAIRAARTALKLEQSADTWQEYGMALLRGGSFLQLAKAQNALRRAVGLYEKAYKPCPDTRLNLAVLSRIRLDLQLSWDQLEKALAENAFFALAERAKQGLEQLAANACERIGGNGIRLGLISSEKDGFDGIANGHNDGALDMRVLSCIDRGAPCMCVVAGHNTDARCILALSYAYDGMVGKTLRIKNFMAQQIELRTHTQTFQFVALVAKNEFDVWIDGKRVNELEENTAIL